MQSTSKLLVTLTLLLATATGAAAATLVSPPLVPEGTNFLDCYLVNVGTKPRPVTIQVFSREGVAVTTVETTDFGDHSVSKCGSTRRGKRRESSGGFPCAPATRCSHPSRSRC